MRNMCGLRNTFYLENKTKDFPKKTHRWPTGTWKDADITNHQENAN